MRKLQRDELIALVDKIIKAEGSESEIDEWIVQLKESVPDPNVSDLIFYSDEPMTAEQIVDKALAYRPMQL